MIKCKREVPISNNQSLLQRDNNPVIGLDQSKGIMINRYVFKNIDDCSKKNDFIRMLTKYIKNIDKRINIYSFISYFKKPNGSNVSGRIITNKLQRDRYELIEIKDHYKAIKNIEEVKKWVANSDRFSNEIILLGYNISDALKCFNNEDTSFLALQKFIPSKQNIELFHKNNISLIYTSRDDLNNIEIILITKILLDKKQCLIFEEL
jgi:hypothetical protein